MSEAVRILDPLQTWLEDYLPKAEGKKPNTIKSYKETWRLMILFLASSGIEPDSITYEMLDYDRITGFLQWLEEKRNCKASTRNNRLSALSKFAKYSLNRDFNSAYIFSKATSVIPFKKENDSIERAYFSRDETKLLLDLPTPRNTMGLRDHVLLQFMYASGARAEEVCIVKVEDVRFLSDGKASVLLHGKGGKTRRIKIAEKPASVLKRYIAQRRIANDAGQYVFHSQRNNRMSVKCIEEIFAKYVNMAKKLYPDLFREKSYPPHSMRHTTAVHMLEAGVPMIVVKQFLGHSQLATTEVYAKLSPEAMNSRITDWDKAYWKDYVDESISNISPARNDGIPDFLR